MTSNTESSTKSEQETHQASDVIGTDKEIYPMIDCLREEGHQWSRIHTALNNASKSIDEKLCNKENISSPTDAVPTKNLIFDFVHDLRIDENSWQTISEHLKQAKELIEETVGEDLYNDNTEQTQENNKPDREYVCTSCNSLVRARWKGPGSFTVGCDCTTVPIVPQLGQDETPDNWQVKRPNCCEGMDVSSLDVIYGKRGKDYMCPKCKAEYFHDGTMVGAPKESIKEEA